MTISSPMSNTVIVEIYIPIEVPNAIPELINAEPKVILSGGIASDDNAYCGP